MTRQTLEHIRVQTGPDPDAAVIWLHGLGADGHDFEPVVPQLGLPADPGIRFIFPHAPVRPVTLNGGMRMRAWYDIHALDPGAPEDIEGLEQSADAVRYLIRQEVDGGVDPVRIVLAGFSQGGAVALHTGLWHREPLAGIIALSTYLPNRDKSRLSAGPLAGALPVFMAHGLMDPVLPYAWGRASAERLAALGCRVEWHEYPMGHGVSPREITDLGRWLTGVLEMS